MKRLTLLVFAVACVSGGDPPPVPVDVPDVGSADVSELPPPPSMMARPDSQSGSSLPSLPSMEVQAIAAVSQ